MADVLTLVFRTFVSDSGLKKTTTPGPPPSTAGGSALLVGDPSTSRSVLLLAAVTAASELGVRVVFFSQTQIQNLPVSLKKRVPSLSPESLKVYSIPVLVESTVKFVLIIKMCWWWRTNLILNLLSALVCKSSKRPSEEDPPLFPTCCKSLVSWHLLISISTSGSCSASCVGTCQMSKLVLYWGSFVFVRWATVSSLRHEDKDLNESRTQRCEEFSGHLIIEYVWSVFLSPPAS